MNRPSLTAEAGAATKYDRRASVRQACHLEALSRTVEASDAITWGGLIDDLSRDGLGLRLCFPFKPNTLLAIELHIGGRKRTFLTRVVHAKDLEDGAWRVGCEFVNPLAENDLAQLL